ncbi:hypothetical protein A6770_37080 [Nostoc minutum NIES-26]|uniref:OLD protein-like TOPRIM domain-containing protein n=1 Tax=Nostoc minutum NIES-26 TaxID=1844469 RepID=A0A367RYJ0_9NOSO|nr:hypothetical protein A6770_37080 [Nostoc minutum NIES-26]
MKHLTDFKPLQRVILPELGEIDCSGLILIVGPNSSGKSQFLKDIYHRVSGEHRELVVAEQVDVRKPEYDPLLDCLKREGYIKTSFDQSVEKIRPMTSYPGTTQGGTEISVQQALSWYQAFVSPATPMTGRNEFLYYFGRMLVTALFLHIRLTSVNRVGMFDYETQPIQNDLHALYMNDEAKSELLREVLTTFSKSVWLDATRGSSLCLRVSDKPLPVEQRHSPQINQTLRSIEDEGDGLKCYVSTCIALLLGRRPICLIDEPEMCLHPPQAYNLGRFIGKYGESPDKVTFVATHSSHVLRGILQINQQKLQIIRLTQHYGKFKAHLVSSEALKRCISKPTVLAESILDGIFAQAVAVVEADGDRTLYQAVWESLGKENQLDIHFAAVNGTGGIADSCNLYKNLKIPIVVIADLDIVANTDHFKQVITELASDISFINDLLERASKIAFAIKQLPPSISVQEVKSQLEVAISNKMDWSKGDDEKLQKQLNEIASKLKKMRSLKQGIKALPEDVAHPLIVLLDDLKKIGLFLVPVGELEDWLAEENVCGSKSKKSAWATAAATLVRQMGAQDGDVWDFMREIANYLQKNSKLCFFET